MDQLEPGICTVDSQPQPEPRETLEGLIIYWPRTGTSKSIVNFCILAELEEQ